MTHDGGFTVVTAEQARAIHWLGGRGTFFATAAESNGAFGIWVDEPPPGGGPVPHVHTREEEFFYVLEGQFTYWCDGRSFAAKPGALVGLPKGLGHQFHNDGPGPGRVLVGVAPGGNEGLFLELGNPYAEPTDATFPPDPARLEAAAGKYGVTLAKPTLLHPTPKPEAVDLPLGVGRAPTLREPGVGEAFAAGGVLLTLKAVADQTLGAYSLTEIEVAARSAFPAHHHDRYTEGLYVLEGELTVRADGPVVAPAGSFVTVPPGAVHALANATDRPLRLLSLSAPAGVEEFYRAAGRPVFDRPARPSAGPVDAERLARLGPQFGVEFA